MRGGEVKPFVCECSCINFYHGGHNFGHNLEDLANQVRQFLRIEFIVSCVCSRSTVQGGGGSGLCSIFIASVCCSCRLAGFLKL